ncbi:Predicted phage recombinase, RecA/RadA family [Paracoccus alcaliphilus]|uniref:Predicted phage recombinase, RecA/RadA family n=1 Tax=Paracoccus alcaliphilus TaxID=34002 RepID=A0A1H8LGF0_9RHOB|nr:DUF2190 family protein [Paracoccus alcaliphilus]WCR18542.1 DUF2190 family protein [Paracoccus alcaliphilus]SEO04143.1 Predicted phage recombinase, RecA/RadA family [Paracoccus alcaliphilus]
MAKNFIQPGNTLTIPAPAGVLSGDVVIAGEIVGIAQGDAGAGEPCDVTTVGVWELPKVAADAVTVGAPIYWDADDSLATTTAAGNTRLGTAVEAAASGAATVKVRLIG